MQSCKEETGVRSLRVRDITAAIEAQFPLRLAMDWDNPGLLCGRADKEVHHVIAALDATDEVIEQAVSEGADLILTHHPMIFRPIAKINEDTSVGRRVIRLIQHDISYYAMHTNFDVGKGGMADLVAERLGIGARTPLEQTGEAEDGTPIGIGFVGELSAPCTAKALAEFVKTSFAIPALDYYDGGRMIQRIAVCPGSGHGMYKYACAAGADAFVTGDMGHHDGLDAIEDGVSLIDAGHFGLEHIYTDWAKKFLAETFPELSCSVNLSNLRHSL